MRKLIFTFSFLLLFHFAFKKIFELKAQPIISYGTIASTGLADPMDIAIPPNASPANGSTRLFILQRNGLIRIWNGTSFSDLVDLSALTTTTGERGFLSMTFHPQYNGTTNRDFFVYYTDLGGDLTVARYRTLSGDPSSIDPAGGTVLITPIEHSLRDNHNGGDINFGPDNLLYLTTGDGGGAGDPDENAQNSSSLLGKLLRIDITAAIPITPVVVDIGLRNPFRWTFDRSTGDAWIGDVGQDTWEEISFKPAGSTGLNFGWDCYEGPDPYELAGCPASGFTFPSYSYSNGAGPRSVVGGYVYRGTEFPSLAGFYLAVDYYTGIVYRRHPAGIWSPQSPALQAGISSFGEAPDGTLYVVSQFSDDLYKVLSSSTLPVSLVRFSGSRSGNTSDLKWMTASEQNTSRFAIEFSKTPTNFERAGLVVASRNPNGSSYSFQHNYNTGNDLFYRLAIEEDNGQVNYSSIIKLSSSGKNGIKIYPTIVRNGILNIETYQPLNKLQLVNSNGAVVFQKDLTGVSGTTAIQLPQLSKGIYFVRVTGNFEVIKEKVVIE